METIYSKSWEEFTNVYQIINVIEFLVAGEALLSVATVIHLPFCICVFSTFIRLERGRR